MVTIRMARGGAKKKPFYSIVVTDSRKRRDSGYIERIGYFNPVARGAEVRLLIDEDKLSVWQGKGAKLSDRVKQLVKEFKDPAIREKADLATEIKLKAINDKKIAAQKAKLAEVEAAAKAKADEAAEVAATEAKATADAEVAAIKVAAAAKKATANEAVKKAEVTKTEVDEVVKVAEATKAEADAKAK